MNGCCEFRPAAGLRRAGGFAGRCVAAYVLLLAIVSTPAAAGPEMCTTAHGDVLITHNGNTWLIQASDLAILNCAGFDIAQFETVQFVQPGALAKVLTRITGGVPTEIQGTLLGNGVVYLVNPAGVMFGSTSVIDVGGIYAAAGQISDTDFMNGNDDTFALSGPVTNWGQIHARSVHLLGSTVANHGMISVDGDSPVLTMLAGNEVVLTPMGGKVMVRLDGEDLTSSLSVSSGNVSPTLSGPAGVENTGVINVSPGGQVVLGAGDFFSLAVRNTGQINAAGSSVNLTGLGAQSTVWQDGTLTAGDLSMTAGVAFLDQGLVADDVDFNDPVLIGRDLTIEASGDVTFHDTLGSEWDERNDLDIDAGSTTFGGAVGGAEGMELGTLEVSGDAFIDGGSVTTINDQVYHDAVVLGADTTINAHNVTFHGTVDSQTGGPVHYGLAVNTSFNGITTFGDAVGASGPLQWLMTNADGTTRIDGGMVATVEDQVYGDDVVLGDDTELTADTVRFEGLVNAATAGGQGLTVHGDAVFREKVGSEVVLRDLTVDGETDLEGQLVATAGNQVYSGAVRLGDETVLNGDLVAFGSTLDGAFGLEIQGDAAFAGRVGGGTALREMEITGDATVATDLVRTTEGQLYGGQVVLGTSTEMVASQVTFNGQVDAASAGVQGLEISGDVEFRDKVGSEAMLADLTVHGTTLVADEAEAIATTGAQVYEGAVTLGTDTVMVGGTIDFQDTLDSDAAAARTLDVFGDVTFGDAVGGTNALARLEVTGAAAIDGGSVTTVNDQVYNGAVTLGAATTVLEATLVEFGATVDGTDPGAQRLEIDAGAAEFHGDVGGQIALDSLDVAGTAFVAGDVTTEGTQTYHQAVTLGDDVELAASLVDFRDTLDAADDGQQGLAIDGDVSFAQAVGSAARLQFLEVSGTAAIDGGSVRTTGMQQYDGAVTLGDDTTLTGSAVAFGSTLDGAANGQQALTVQGDAVFGGAVGVQARLESLDVTGDATLAAGQIRTTGDQDYRGDVLVGASTTLSGVDVTFHGAVDSTGGSHGLTVNTFQSGVTTFLGAVGQNQALASLFTNGDGTTVFHDDVRVAGGLTILDPLELAGDAKLRAGADGVRFGSTIDGGFDLDVRSDGDILFEGDVGSSERLGSLKALADGLLLVDASLVSVTGDIDLRAGLGDDSPTETTMQFADGLTLEAGDDIRLNVGALDAAPAVATIGVDGSLTIQAGDVFEMGENQKLTVVGDLVIMADTAILSDITTLNDLVVDANDIFILSRPPSTIVDADGVAGLDQGVDFVAGGEFFFFAVPVVIGDFQVFFASPTGEGDAMDTLRDFVMQAVGDVSRDDLVREISTGAAADQRSLFLDLRAQGPTNTDVAAALAGALPRESETEEVQQDSPVPASVRARLAQDLGIQPRSLRSDEIVALGAGRALYLDQPQSMIRPEARESRILVNRMLSRLARAVVDIYEGLDTEQTPPEHIQGVLAEGWSGYRAELADEAGPAGFAAWLQSTGRSEALFYLQRLEMLMRYMDLLGPTRAELREPKGGLLASFQPAGMTAEQFEEAVHAAGRAAPAPPAPAPAMPEPGPVETAGPEAPAGLPAPETVPAEPVGDDILDDLLENPGG